MPIGATRYDALGGIARMPQRWMTKTYTRAHMVSQHESRGKLAFDARIMTTPQLLERGRGPASALATLTTTRPTMVKQCPQYIKQARKLKRKHR